MPKYSIILLLMLLAGCDLTPPASKLVVDEPATKTKATLEAIEQARQAAYQRYLDCRERAESTYNDELEVKGTPVPGKKGVYTEKVPGAFEKLKQQENFEDTECRKVYEAELGVIQPRVQRPPELAK